jgi:pimeloyl-ACP methyl ester carboxylesterase
MTASLPAEESGFHCREHDQEAAPTLIYLPGMHGDWTLLGPFRNELRGKCRLVEFTYPRRTDWCLADYATVVLDELHKRGITHGWLLGESFSSQIVWAIADRLIGLSEGRTASAFLPQGIILVGGFVKHPFLPGVRLAYRTSQAIPAWLLGCACRAYGRVARKRCAVSGTDGAEIDLFVARRLTGTDRHAITSRYLLIRDEDCRAAARETRWPVYCLTGAWDPIVPWPLVWRWIRRRCPGFRAARVLWGAGHNVLLDLPKHSAEQILFWISAPGTSPGASGKAGRE